MHWFPSPSLTTTAIRPGCSASVANAQRLPEVVLAGGTVTAWTWVAEPRPGKHHLGKPFAFALVRPDGADTAMVHVIDVPPDSIAVGMRVQPRWRVRAVGDVTDLDVWVPLADGAEPDAAPPNQAEGVSDEPVTGINTPIRLDYEINAGLAAGKYLRGLAEHKILGARAEDSDQVYVPPRGSDPTSGAPTTVEVEVADTGTVTTFCVVNIPGCRTPRRTSRTCARRSCSTSTASIFSNTRRFAMHSRTARRSIWQRRMRIILCGTKTKSSSRRKAARRP